jgi:hypothetical protein
MQQKLRKLADKYPDRMMGALRVEAELIMTDSKQNYVPRKLGTLRGSGYVNEPEVKSGEIVIEMGFGGAAKDYALAIHEYPSSHDPPSWKGADVTFHPEGHGAKYLEIPLKNAVAGIGERLAQRLKVDKS